MYVHDGEGDFRVEPGSVILVRVEERLQDSRVLVGNSVERIVLGRGLRPLPGEFRKRP